MDTLLDFLQQWGVLGLFVGSFLAATVIPFASDVLYVGVLAAGAPPFASFLSASIGNWLGGITSFGVGWLGKWEWIEKWFKVKRETLEKQKCNVDKWGPLLALMTWLPFVGDVFAIALGFYKTKPWLTFLYMLIGKTLRFAVWSIFFI